MKPLRCQLLMLLSIMAAGLLCWFSVNWRITD